MQVKKLLTDDEGVSPVIGVILMVAITVILAAVIAAFVLGIGDTDDPAPNANIEIDTSSSYVVTLDHTSGDAITVADTQISIGDQQDTLDSVSGLSNVDGGATTDPSGEVAAGDSIEITLASGSFSSGDEVTIQLIHAPEGDASNVFFEETVEVVT